MRRDMALMAVLCAAIGVRIGGAQTKLDLRTQGRGVDFAAADSTRPAKTGTALPAACQVGEFYFRENAAAGSNLYGCTATNTWSLLGGGSTNGVVSAGETGCLAYYPSSGTTVDDVHDTGCALKYDAASDEFQVLSTAGTVTLAIKRADGGIENRTGNPTNFGGVTDDTPPGAPASTNRFTQYVDRADGKWKWHLNGQAQPRTASEEGHTHQAYATVQDEGSGLTQRASVNFTGSGVSCADDAGNTRTNCTITGGGSGASISGTGKPVLVPFSPTNGTSQSGTLYNKYLYCAKFIAPVGFTVAGINLKVTTAGTAGNGLAAGVYGSDGNIIAQGTITGLETTGFKRVTMGTAGAIPAGWCYFCMATEDTAVKLLVLEYSSANVDLADTGEASNGNKRFVRSASATATGTGSGLALPSAVGSIGDAQTNVFAFALVP